MYLPFLDDTDLQNQNRNIESNLKSDSGTDLKKVGNSKRRKGRAQNKCSMCMKIFPSPSKLERHQKSHNSSGGEKRCKFCRQTFPSTSKLILHLRVHRNQPINKCLICMKTFQTPSKLERHQRSHSGEKPFSCKLCFKGFSQNANLKTHILSKHVKLSYGKDKIQKD